MMKVAKEAGALLSYNPNLWLPLWPSPMEAREQIMSIWDAKLEFLTGEASVEDEVAMKLWRPTLKLLLVTIGDKGCNYYTKDFHKTVGSFVVKPLGTPRPPKTFGGPP
ncbi:fructokinase-2-like [Phoenix dactylifera]|uniref:Fructokinase-2-like n=1 Tax=Phoenix dactylifera TaxID=42345 RepID=A0A8B9ARC2_PHODC|nr:fructokinase-2-like [Phoenix dactylifera]